MAIRPHRRIRRTRKTSATLTAIFTAVLVLTSGCTAPAGGGTDVSVDGQDCATGRLLTSAVDAESGDEETRPAASATWVLTATAGDELAHGLTDFNGRFTACADDGATSGTLTFSAERPSLWTVAHPDDADEVWSFTTDEVDLGTQSAELRDVSVPSSLAGAFVISSAASELYAKRATESPCWTDHQTSLVDCHEVVFTWADNVAEDDGGFWDAADTGHIVLAGADARSRSVIVHELAHWWHNELYVGAFPEATDCNPHYIDAPSSPSCAWTEGFADAVSGRVLDRTGFVASDGQSTPFVPEDGGSYPGGDSTQGNVAAALLDLWALDVGDGGDGDGSWAADIELLSAHVDGDFTSWFTDSRAHAGLPTTGDAAEIVRSHGIDIR